MTISIFISISILSVAFSFGQITLEKEYKDLHHYSFSAVQIDENTMVYIGLNDLTNTINIYSLNHDLIKSITIPNSIIQGRELTGAGVFLLSKYLFNADDKFEYAITVINEPNYEYSFSTYILDESGEVLLDASNFKINGNFSYDHGMFGVYKDLEGNYKLSLETFRSDTSLSNVRVYNIPGRPYILKKANYKINEIGNVFPNPTNNKKNTITHGYLSSGTLFIYSQIGQLTKKIQIKSNSRETEVDLSDLTSGLYYYQIYNEGKKIGSKKAILN